MISKPLLLTLVLLVGLLAGVICVSPAQADSWEVSSETGKVATTHSVTGKSVGGAALSLLVWPGIGQAINDEPGKKVGTHAVLGLLPPFRFWSAYDALVRREGGYWKGKI